MKRSERISTITYTLSSHPGKLFSLDEFTQKLDASKTSISEDIQIIRENMQKNHLGDICSSVGSGGGVWLVPSQKPAELEEKMRLIEKKLADPRRILLDEYIYYGDILSNPDDLRTIALYVLATLDSKDIDAVLTIETKGISLAQEIARLLHAQLIVARKSNRISEGNTMGVHYRSESSTQVKSMYVSRFQSHENKKILVVDDYLKGGGTLLGLRNMARELGASVVDAVIFLENMQKQQKVDGFFAVFTDEGQRKSPKLNTIMK